MVVLVPCIVIFCASLLSAQSPGNAASPELQDYKVVRLNLSQISSEMWESHPAIDPLTGDLWFVRSDSSFSGWRILVSRCKNGTLQPPVESPFAAAGIEADPYFSKSGTDFYYISSRNSGSKSSTDLDIWHVKRTPKGKWSEPEELPEPVNSKFAEWFPRPDSDGWLYFGSHRSGGVGKDDIWRARVNPDGKWTVENAGPVINTPDAEYEFLPSPDGKWALLATDKGLYRVDRGPGGWTHRSRLNNEINATGTEIGPMLLDAGGSFLFSRDAGDKKSGELFIAYRASQVKISNACTSFQRAIKNAIAPN